jgi:hypothetical protein
MAVVGPNIMNTIDVASRLPLMRAAKDAKRFTQKLGFHAVFVPSNLGGRLRVGFRGWDSEAAKKSLGVVDPHGIVHKRDASGEVRIDIKVRERGSGLFHIAVLDESMDYTIYALFDETGTARQADGTPLIPWNFWYFPFADARKDKSAWGGTTLQPLQKYERAFGETGVLAWEQEHHADPRKSRPIWEGHCHLAAIASIMFVNPMPQGFEFNGEWFLAEELKFFGAEFVGRFGNAERVYHLPVESGDPDDPSNRSGRFHEKKPSDEPALFGTRPGALVELLRVLRREIGVEGRALAMDFRDPSGSDHAEVWNQAVYGYRIRYWQPDITDPTLTDGVCTLFANADSHTGEKSSGLPAHTVVEHGETVIKHDGDRAESRSEFTLRFTAAGDHDTSAPENRWRATTQFGIDTFAPRFAYRIWKPSKTVIGALGNPRIDPRHVLKLLRLRPEFL